MYIEKIKEQIAHFLETLGVKVDSIEVSDTAVGNKPTFIIKTPESGILIGDRGETLQALFHLVRRIVQKEQGEDVDFSIDINDYRAHKAEELRMKARMLANRARDMRTDVEMDSMSSYDRLIVHDALANETDIKTESAGEGKNRHVVIKYQQQ